MLGVGISCEFDAGERPGLDALALRSAHPDLVHFLEVGADLDRGLDPHMLRWGQSGLPATYHFLDVNLAERQGADAAWIDQTVAQARAVGALWLCGDAGYWHLGRRERGHGLLLPPVLCDAAAREMAQAIAWMQDRSGMLVLPENPPAAAWVGPLHLLDFYAQVVTHADCGLLLDAAHLAVFQRMKGLDATHALDRFPLDRVVEIHVAGGAVRDHQGYAWVEDTHDPEPLPECWEILDYVLPRAPNLKAIVYECEHNAAAQVVPVFQRLNVAFPAGPVRPVPQLEPSGEPPAPQPAGPHQSTHRVAVRALFDPTWAEGWTEASLVQEGLEPEHARWLLDVDARAWSIDGDRPVRTLRALFQEFPGSTTLAMDALGSQAALLEFFRSPVFHAELQARGSVAAAWTKWLQTVPGWTPDVARVEGAQAQCRRELHGAAERLEAGPAGEWLARSEGCTPLTVDSHALAALNAAERWLFEVRQLPALALASDRPTLALPPKSGAPVHLVARPVEGEIHLVQMGRVVAQTLRVLGHPMTLADAAAALGHLVPGHVVPRLLRDLHGAGLIRRGTT